MTHMTSSRNNITSIEQRANAVVFFFLLVLQFRDRQNFAHVYGSVKSFNCNAFTNFRCKKILSFSKSHDGRAIPLVFYFTRKIK